eukprot:CAMPEP_0172467234 /NCGR_PEP_ID=MMETSP1065-20121228/58286_1 /TAXON_ID=265537 /ORGANISM="Amphiprora paludosa, Strain CCMP125" /LENGTH=141 /DNA_ID=CAMNT_0013224317 /DNA_START=221 /DNA_END=643 /DNA_ORIENTATION=-
MTPVQQCVLLLSLVVGGFVLIATTAETPEPHGMPSSRIGSPRLAQHQQSSLPEMSSSMVMSAPGAVASASSSIVMDGVSNAGSVQARAPLDEIDSSNGRLVADEWKTAMKKVTGNQNDLEQQRLLIYEGFVTLEIPFGTLA